VKWTIAALLLAPASGSAARPLPIYDATALNIGINCQWQRKCMSAQEHAMKHALSFVNAKHPSRTAMQHCNRNARRGPSRIDWIGFDNCIRNASFR
jgi:hypothetical protein